MLRFDKAIIFLPILKSNLLLSFNNKTCDLGVLLFSEFVNAVSTFIHIWVQFYCIDLIMLLHTFLVICFDWYKEQTICIISFNKLSELLSAFICERAIGNLWSIYLGCNILSLE